MKWICIKDQLPCKGDLIVYCSNTRHISAIGIYWGDPNDPKGLIPSCPNYLTWEKVTHWFKLDEVDKK